MSLSTTIKTIQDIMRKDVGVDGDAQRIGQLVWLLFLKIFDDKEQEWELAPTRYRSPIPPELRWRNWAADAEGKTGDALLEFVNNQLFPTLKNLSAGSISDKRGLVVRRAFEDSYQYMKNGTLLRQVINKINESIDFNDSKHRHLFGEMYEQILKDLQSAGNAGEYYTPRAVTQFMVDQVNPRLGETVLDPACGTGGFLACAIEHIRKLDVNIPEEEEKLQATIFGVDKKPLPHLLCVTNMLLHGIDVPAMIRPNSGIDVPEMIRHDNTLAKPIRDYKPKDFVDVVLTNPPFGGMEEDGIETNFPKPFQTRETADLFLVLIMHLLKPGGRAAIVLPDGTLFGEGVKTRIKEKLLDECNLHTIVRLPNGVFSPYTGIKTNLLFFTKGEPTKVVWYYEHPYPPGYKSYSKTKPIRIEEFAPEKKWWSKRKVNEHAWKVPVEQIKASGYNLDIKNPHDTSTGHTDPAELLADYQRLLGDLQQTRDRLKQELRTALERSAS
jgi:type I restriction enzyme M protein